MAKQGDGQNVTFKDGRTGTTTGSAGAVEEYNKQYKEQGSALGAAGKGALAGATAGMGFGGVYGAAVGGVLGGIGGLLGYYDTRDKGEAAVRKQYEKDEKDRKEQERQRAILQRQMATTSQQMGRARSAEGASTIKQPTMSTPAGDDIAMAAMPVATRRGTQYDAWRQQTYGS